MAAWSEGYFTDIQYTGRCYPEMAPGFLAFACLRQGVRPPELGAGSTYLELGCGQGFGLNLLAAANPGMSFWGIDFHAGQIANALRLARDSGLSNVTFEDLSFAQMLELPDGGLPKFDIIALHGVWSWVSPENRAAIVQILERALKPGGLVYVSYNSLPGWAPLIPMQRFVREYVARAPGDPRVEVVKALQAAQEMLAGGAQYFQGVPALKRWIADALKEDPAYLVHEHLNAHSSPLFHSDVAKALEPARLSFAASANIADDLVNLAAPEPLRPRIVEAQDPTWRETLLDYATANPFRRDIFVRGRNALTRRERDALLDETRFTLLKPAGEVTFDFPVPLGQLKGQPGVYGPMVEALAEGPRTYRELTGLPSLNARPDGVVLQAVTLLVGSRQIHPMAPPEDDAAAVAFNRAILRRMGFDEFPTYLACRGAGSAVPVSFEDLVAADAALRGEDDALQAARAAWGVMARTGRRLLRDGEILNDQATNESELARRVAEFNRSKLPLFRSLGVI